MRKLWTTLAIVWLLAVSYVAAADTNYQMVLPVESNTMPMADGMTEKDMWVQPVYPAVTYTFDEKKTKELIEQWSAIVEVKCNGKAVLNAMGLGSATMNQLLSIGYAEGVYEYNFDFRSCALRGNNPSANWSNMKSLTDSQALQFAKDFMQSGKLGNKVFNMVWEPIIIAKNNYGGGYPMPMYDARAESAITSNAPIKIDGITIDETDPQMIDNEFTNYSILLPYKIGGKYLYNQRWWKAGISLEINSDGVTSFNAQLLPFTAVRRDAQKISGDEAVAFIKKWWNNPFRWQAQEIKLNAPEKTYMLFNLWRNGKTELYLASGIRLWSEVKQDQRSQQNYEMIISDYRVGNPNIGY